MNCNERQNEEGLNLISQNKLSPAQFEDYLRNKVMRECSLKTYDPAFSYDKQPFYRIKESLICKDAQGQPIVIYPGTLIEEPKGPNELLWIKIIGMEPMCFV